MPNQYDEMIRQLEFGIIKTCKDAEDANENYVELTAHDIFMNANLHFYNFVNPFTFDNKQMKVGIINVLMLQLSENLTGKLCPVLCPDLNSHWIPERVELVSDQQNTNPIDFICFTLYTAHINKKIAHAI